jgi:hypothetical protein
MTGQNVCKSTKAGNRAHLGENHSGDHKKKKENSIQMQDQTHTFRDHFLGTDQMRVAKCSQERSRERGGRAE